MTQHYYKELVEEKAKLLGSVTCAGTLATQMSNLTENSASPGGDHWGKDSGSEVTEPSEKTEPPGTTATAKPTPGPMRHETMIMDAKMIELEKMLESEDEDSIDELLKNNDCGWKVCSVIRRQLCGCLLSLTNIDEPTQRKREDVTAKAKVCTTIAKRRLCPCWN